MKKKQLLLFSVCTLIFLSGCMQVTRFFKDFQQRFLGLEMVMQTYDETGKIIDRIVGQSVSIERDQRFDTTDESVDSSVLAITVGGYEVSHVGSSLILYETGLEDIFEEYRSQVAIEDEGRSVPIMNRMVNEFKNSFTGKDKVILIRSQRGFPLATFAGDKVSVFKSEVPKSTGLLIDGKSLFIYRCDYTIYDRALIENE